MGLFDFFKMGKVLAHAARKVRDQRGLAREIAVLPMPEFVQACLQNLNQSAGNWTGRMRPADPSSGAIARQLRLPAEVVEFYSVCDGYEAIVGEFPAPICRVSELRTGAQEQPPISEVLKRSWIDEGNESDREGMLSILPPDDLPALMAGATDSFLSLAQADAAVVLSSPREGTFDLLLTEDQGPHLPAGTVVDVEGGSATRYPSFKSWLAARASLYGSMSNWGSSR